MGLPVSAMNTDQVAASERAGFWTDCIHRLFRGLDSDLYGDTDFQGRMTTLQAGDIVLTRLEAHRHRALRTPTLARHTDAAYLKIVAPWAGCASVEQQGREAWVAPGQWSIYDTTDSYLIANPVQVEHLIVMLPRERLAERGLPLDALMARRLGGDGGVARLALETMRTAYHELPGMSEAAACGVGDAITQFVHLSLLDLAGRGTAVTQREALRERIKTHVGEHLGDSALTVDRIATSLGCSRRQLYNAFEDEPDGVAGYLLRRRIDACRQSFDDRRHDHRSITDIALGFGFSNMAHFSRVFRAQLGLPPRDYRRTALLNTASFHGTP